MKSRLRDIFSRRGGSIASKGFGSGVLASLLLITYGCAQQPSHQGDAKRQNEAVASATLNRVEGHQSDRVKVKTPWYRGWRETLPLQIVGPAKDFPNAIFTSFQEVERQIGSDQVALDRWSGRYLSRRFSEIEFIESRREAQNILDTLFADDRLTPSDLNRRVIQDYFNGNDQNGLLLVYAIDHELLASGELAIYGLKSAKGEGLARHSGLFRLRRPLAGASNRLISRQAMMTMLTLSISDFTPIDRLKLFEGTHSVDTTTVESDGMERRVRYQRAEKVEWQRHKRVIEDHFHRQRSDLLQRQLQHEPTPQKRGDLVSLYQRYRQLQDDLITRQNEQMQVANDMHHKYYEGATRYLRLLTTPLSAADEQILKENGFINIPTPLFGYFRDLEGEHHPCYLPKISEGFPISPLPGAKLEQKRMASISRALDMEIAAPVEQVAYSELLGVGVEHDSEGVYRVTGALRSDLPYLVDVRSLSGPRLLVTGADEAESAVQEPLNGILYLSIYPEWIAEVARQSLQVTIDSAIEQRSLPALLSLQPGVRDIRVSSENGIEFGKWKIDIKAGNPTLLELDRLPTSYLQRLELKFLNNAPPESLERLPLELLNRLPEETLLTLSPATLRRLSLPVFLASTKLQERVAEIDQEYGIPLRWVPAGCFIMGSGNGPYDERPPHRICVDGFYLSETEVTQQQWQQVMGYNPARFRQQASRPVEQVSWNDIQGFLKRLNQQQSDAESEVESKPVSEYALPTEAEWEYACLASSDEMEPREDDLDRLAWYRDNSLGETHPVAKKEANRLGFYDMQGNVWEWVTDWYLEEAYAQHRDEVAIAPDVGSEKVHRGGGWGMTAKNMRCRNRSRLSPQGSVHDIGFRLLRRTSRPLGENPDKP